MFGLHNDKVITVAIPEFFKALRNMPVKTAKTVRIKSRIKPRRKPRGKSKKHHVPTKFYSYRLGKGYDEAWRANMSAANEELPTLSERLRAMEINNAVKDNECPICLDEMTDDGANTTLNCGHKFHNICLENMIRHGHNRCPLCRTATSDHLKQRQEIIELEERITSLRDRLNNPNRNMRLNNAMQIQRIAARYEEEAQRHYNEAYLQFTTYIRLHGIDVNIPMYIELSNMRTITLDLLTRARENTRSARQLFNNIRHINISSYNIT
jgi:hypothetical protein